MRLQSLAGYRLKASKYYFWLEQVSALHVASSKHSICLSERLTGPAHIRFSRIAEKRNLQ